MPDAEARLLLRRGAPADPVGAAREALALAWGGPPPNRLRAAARRLGEAVAAHGAAFAPGAEPAYHDRHHQAEATLAAGWLAAAARAGGRAGPESAALLVLAMAGHDLLHTGQAALPGALELRSAEAADALLADDLSAAERAEIRRVILLTDPGAPCDAADLRGRWAREADLFGSLLPRLGPRLGALLARELAASGQAEAAAEVGSHTGRLALLRRLGALTDEAAAVGLRAARDLQLDAYARAGLAKGEGAEAAAARLDALPPADAARAWEGALAAAEAGAP